MLRALLAAAGIAATGCGTSTDPVALDEFTPSAIDAVCEWAVRCLHVPDRPTCERLIDPKQYDTRRTEDAVAAGRMLYDADAAGRCVASTRAGHCLAEPFSDLSCGEMLVGVLTEGQACTSSYECADGARCDNVSCSGQCCLGACGPPPSSLPQPPERAAVGEPCQTHTDCVVGAYCTLESTCAETPDTEGAPCLFGCARGDLYCDVVDLVCKRYGALGEACDPDGETAPPCDAAWSYCDQTCKHRPGPGEMCDDVDRRCIATTFCQGGVCVERGGAGATCSSSQECVDICNDLSGQCVEYQTCGT